MKKYGRKVVRMERVRPSGSFNPVMNLNRKSFSREWGPLTLRRIPKPDRWTEKLRIPTQTRVLVFFFMRERGGGWYGWANYEKIENKQT